MVGILSKAKEVRERLYPILKESAFLDRGVLTPEEFIQAGDELCQKCPTWQWSSGDPCNKKKYLPNNKQFLITNNVPCPERAKAVESSVDASILAEIEGDEWVTATTIHDSTRADEEEEEIFGLSEKEEDPQLDDLEDSTIIDHDEATVAPGGGKKQIDNTRNKAESDNILKTRTYDLSITYDKYWQTPRMWLFGYDEQARPLTQTQVFEDIVLDYARRTVTFESHPHLSGAPHASIHPCKHPAAMKRIIDNYLKSDQPPRPDQALFLFLKFISSVVPTIRYDFTLDVQLS
uniref:Autophagy-related protein 3 n=1 Tax=Aureoumbra lagunensis TaxID=44058 RepID=A0A7S3NPB1_9STRA|mmetsp:Transcript_12648/g.18962  ORF Transcript_12648/g.18962 Transcript_12648/m.18962 type:complete len:291 (+) Transcript_12648:52-924(+)